MFRHEMHCFVYIHTLKGSVVEPLIRQLYLLLNVCFFLVKHYKVDSIELIRLLTLFYLFY